MAGAAAIVMVMGAVVAVSGVGVPESLNVKTTFVKVPEQEAGGAAALESRPPEVSVRHGGNTPLPLARAQLA